MYYDPYEVAYRFFSHFSSFYSKAGFSIDYVVKSITLLDQAQERINKARKKGVYTEKHKIKEERIKERLKELLPKSLYRYLVIDAEDNITLKLKKLPKNIPEHLKLYQDRNDYYIISIF